MVDEVFGEDEEQEEEQQPEANLTVEIIDNSDECNGCLLDEKCYTLGYRKAMNNSLRYCDDNSEWHYQMVGESSCQNSFECESNVCVDSKCIDSGFIQKIINFFKRLYG
jgi:hypothetical protein